MTRYIFIAVLAMITLAQDVHLKISDTGEGKMPVAVLPFVARTAVYGDEERTLSRQMTYVLRNDVDFSPFFQVVDTSLYPVKEVQSKSDIDFFKWSSAGVQAIIYGTFNIGSRLKVNIDIYSVGMASKVFSHSYSSDIKQARRLVHSIADDVSKALTGEEGVAQTQLAFISTRGGHKEVFLCDYDGYAVRQLTQNRSITISPDWSPDGIFVSYTSYKNENPDLYMMDVYQGKERLLSDFTGLNAQGAFCPDGRKVALTLSRDGNSEIYVIDIRTKHTTRLTYNWAIDTSPCWSPTGDEIAFCSDRSGTPQIYIMDATGANVRRLTFGGAYCDEPSWSPRGDVIAYTTKEQGLFQIATIGVSGENDVILTSVGCNESPDWSPDGYHLVFTSNRSGAYQIYTMDWDGSNIRRLTNSIGNNTAPRWSARYKWSF